MGALSGILGACWHLLTILWSALDPYYSFQGQFWVHADHPEPHLLLYLDHLELRFTYLSGSLNIILKKCLQVTKVLFLTADFREGCSQHIYIYIYICDPRSRVLRESPPIIRGQGLPHEVFGFPHYTFCLPGHP